LTADSTGPAAGAVAADEAALFDAVRRQPLPRHVAVIMDGNGRWAGQRGLPRVAGHREGVRAARDTVRAAGRLGIEYLTLYAFSSENWTRPAAEVSFLMRLLESSVDAELPGLVDNNVRLRTLGELATLYPGVRQSVERAVRATEANTGLTLLIALNYGGRAEITDAVRRLVRDFTSQGRATDDIDEATLSSYLYTAGQPDPDLLIRTSGEMRISNFLLWQIAYAEIWVTDVLWPDFRVEHLHQGIRDFAGRERRYGAVTG